MDQIDLLVPLLAGEPADRTGGGGRDLRLLPRPRRPEGRDGPGVVRRVCRALMLVVRIGPSATLIPPLPVTCGLARSWWGSRVSGTRPSPTVTSPTSSGLRRGAGCPVTQPLGKERRLLGSLLAWSLRRTMSSLALPRRCSIRGSSLVASLGTSRRRLSRPLEIDTQVPASTLVPERASARSTAPSRRWSPPASIRSPNRSGVAKRRRRPVRDPALWTVP